MSPLGFVKARLIEQLSAPLLQRTTVSNRIKTDLNVNHSHYLICVIRITEGTYEYKTSVCMYDGTTVCESPCIATQKEPCDCKSVIIYVRIVCISQNKERYLTMCQQYMLVLYVSFYGLDQLNQYRVKLHMM